MSNNNEKQPSAPPVYGDTPSRLTIDQEKDLRNQLANNKKRVLELGDEVIQLGKAKDAVLYEKIRLERSNDSLKCEVKTMERTAHKHIREMIDVGHQIRGLYRAVAFLICLVVLCVVGIAVMMSVIDHVRSLGANRAVKGEYVVGVVESGPCTLYVSGVFTADDVPDHAFDFSYSNRFYDRCITSRREAMQTLAESFRNKTGTPEEGWMYIRDIKANRGNPPCATPMCGNPWEVK